MRQRNVSLGLLALCTAVAGWITQLTPRIGRCGSAMYFTFRILSGLLLLSLNVKSPHFQGIAMGVTVLLGAVVFFVPAFIWYRKAPRGWFIAGLALWFALYAGAYFFYHPVPDCP